MAECYPGTWGLSTPGRIESEAVRPEMELLLLCSRTRIDAETGERIRRLLHRDLDWVYLIVTAIRQGVLSLLYWSLQTNCPEAAPEETLLDLRDHFQANAAASREKVRALIELLDLLRMHGITGVPYKGPLLASELYGDVSLRKFGDLDVLVRKHDVWRARHLLISEGYVPDVRLSLAEEAAHLRSYYHWGFTLNGIGLELHWAIQGKAAGFPLEMDRLWERLQPTELEGRAVHTLAAEDLLLVLCVHGAKHLWQQLRWICDVAELLRAAPHLDWSMVLEQARRLGGERRLWIGLLLARDLLRAPLPEVIALQAETDAVAVSLARGIGRRLVREDRGFSQQWRQGVFWLRMRDNRRDMVRYGLHLVQLIARGSVQHLMLPYAPYRRGQVSLGD